MFTPSLLSSGSHTSEFLFPSTIHVAVRRGSRDAPLQPRGKSPQHRHSAPQVRIGRALVVVPRGKDLEKGKLSGKSGQMTTQRPKQGRRSPPLGSLKNLEAVFMPGSPEPHAWNGLKGWNKLRKLLSIGVLMPKLTFLVRDSRVDVSVEVGCNGHRVLRAFRTSFQPSRLVSVITHI
jgi:hypothetical protein